MQLHHAGVTLSLATSTAENNDEYMCQVAGACSLCSGCCLDTVHSFAQPVFMFNMTAVLTADSKLWSHHGTRANEHMTEIVEQRTR